MKLTFFLYLSFFSFRLLPVYLSSMINFLYLFLPFVISLLFFVFFYVDIYFLTFLIWYPYTFSFVSSPLFHFLSILKKIDILSNFKNYKLFLPSCLFFPRFASDCIFTILSHRFFQLFDFSNKKVKHCLPLPNLHQCSFLFVLFFSDIPLPSGRSLSGIITQHLKLYCQRIIQIVFPKYKV